MNFEEYVKSALAEIKSDLKDLKELIGGHEREMWEQSGKIAVLGEKVKQNRWVITLLFTIIVTAVIGNFIKKG